LADEWHTAMKGDATKTAIAKKLGIARSSLYYHHTLPEKDWRLKVQMEDVLHEYPSYGHKRIATHLGINKKRALRVMKLFGIKPYRRRRKPRIKGNKDGAETIGAYENLLLRLSSNPDKPDTVWVSDFTYLPYQGRFVYVATVMDMYTREVVGKHILTAHTIELIWKALIEAVYSRPCLPHILHSDPGSEYRAKEYVHFAESLGIDISMTRKAHPWENGYQESFYSQFKLDLGDPNTFQNLGELVYGIYHTIYIYNHKRIHTALKMPPAEFCQRHYQRSS